MYKIRNIKGPPIAFNDFTTVDEGDEVDIFPLINDQDPGK